jgi:amino acid adenylation domain-containing protein
MRSLVARSQVSLGAVLVEELVAKFDKNSDKFHFILPGSLYRLLAATAAVEHLQEPLVLLTVFQEVLRRYTGQKSVTVRFSAGETLRSISVLEEGVSLRAMVERLQTHADVPNNSNSLNITLDGQFSFQSFHLASGSTHPSANTSGIHCSLQSSAEALTGWIQLERKIWDPALIQYFLASYRNVLSAALSSPDVRLEELEILTAADIEKFDAWNANGRYYPHARVDELFELRVLEKPDDTALTFLDRSLSYRALSDKMKQFALRMQNLGVQPGTLVGICMDRCPEMVVALLATFRAGAAYLPLDPAFPQSRIDFMQQDARPLVVVTQTHLRQKISFPAAHVLCVDEDEPVSCSRVACLPSRAATLDDVAYVLYTSGSTGKPKGVQITHRALTNMLTVVAEDVGLESTDVLLATTTISFDISTFEIFAPLITGAHLVVAPRAVAVNGELLARAILESGATLLQATPAGWQVLLEAGWQGQAGLKMLTAGEPLSSMLAQRLLERGASLWNLYGPTEATVYATGRRIDKDTTKITVGPPLANYTTYVLDQHRRRLPIGAIGELFLGGIGVGAGYLNRPELTTEKFLPDPFSADPAARLYRTGDLARMLPNGEIDLLGRVDNQIKLRGYRIELEEIEALLDSHPGISKSVVRVADAGDGDQTLVAYVVPRQQSCVAEAEWRAHAARSLPSYMVPASFVVMKSFALTPSGKVDRKALPAFAKPVDSESGNAEQTLEQAVLRCWRRVLGRPALDLDHNFFEAGGHSLLVMRMFAEINNMLGYKLPISLLVEAPTVRQFVDLALQIREVPPKYLVLMQPEGSLPPIYLVHHLLGDVLIYRSLAHHFAPDRPVYGIQPPVDLIHRSQPYSLRALASDYVEEILGQQTAGPIHLAGFSSGSVLAFEMASQLRNRGFAVGLLALIDGDVQATSPRIPAAVKCAKVVIRKLYKIAFKLRDEVAVGPRQFVTKRLRYLWLQGRIRMLENSSSRSEVTMEQALLLAERAYEGKPYAGSALLIRFHDEAWKFGPDPLMGWSGLVNGGIDVVDLPGGHITGMGPVGAPGMVALLNSHMEKSEI